MATTPSSVQVEPGDSNRRRRHRRKHGGRSKRRQIVRNIIVGFLGAAICAGTYYYWEQLTR